MIEKPKIILSDDIESSNSKQPDDFRSRLIYDFSQTISSQHENFFMIPNSSLNALSQAIEKRNALYEIPEKQPLDRTKTIFESERKNLQSNLDYNTMTAEPEYQTDPFRMMAAAEFIFHEKFDSIQFIEESPPQQEYLDEQEEEKSEPEKQKQDRKRGSSRAGRKKKEPKDDQAKMVREKSPLQAKNVTTRKKKVANIKPLKGQMTLDSYFGKSRTLPVGSPDLEEKSRQFANSCNEFQKATIHRAQTVSTNEGSVHKFETHLSYSNKEENFRLTKDHQNITDPMKRSPTYHEIIDVMGMIYQKSHTSFN